MLIAPKPENEKQRLDELFLYDILDTEDEKEFDDLTQLASDICGTPIALISLIDQNRQWFKSRVGLDATETERDIAFCTHAILQQDVFEVEDTHKDERFSDNPLVTGAPNIRFYAGTPLMTPSGYPLGTLCAISDQPKKLSFKQRRAIKVLGNEVVSRLELRKKIRQLEKANEFKSIFVSNVSHEIRTPINGVMGLVKLLKQTQLTPQQTQYLNTIQRSGDALVRIVNDVLDLSKVESGKLEIEHNNFSYSQLVSDVVECFRPLASEKGLSLETDTTHFRKYLVGDSHRIRQILSNLVSNAIKFTESGKVVISDKVLLQDDKHIQIKIMVSDTGIGLTDYQADMIFERFQQADSTINREYGGSGLGLSICRQLTQMMGGEINVESEAGNGALFWISIPLAVSAEEIALHDEGLDEILPDKLSGRVLVAEDNRVNQIVAKGVFETLGLEVEIAKNGAVALSMLKSNPYDLVFMDCHMPVMDGFEAVKNIRSGVLPIRNPGVPIVAMTANAMESDKRQCFSIGMDEFISKPLDLQQVRRIVAKYLEAAPKVNHVSNAGKAVARKTQSLNQALQQPVFCKKTAQEFKIDSEQLDQIFNVFWQNAPGEINQLSKAMIDDDHEKVRKAAHGLKGSAIMLGGERFAAVAGYIEHQAIKKEELSAAKLIPMLERILESFHEAVNAWK